ncbi:hypothetical protein ACFQU3_10655 [Terrabacter sp. GCM10028922]|jgi:hypothetical protein|uniref:hypothetical protein n=1 Tax=Terrabacter sp. GCM10028922 TaxID=3273428 RepID=UPI0036228C78
MSSVLSTMSRTRKRALAAGAVVLAGAGISATMMTPAAQAIPIPQKSCAFDAASNTPANGWRPVNSAVTINNGAVGRYVVVNFNADAGVSTLAEIRLGYRVDLGGVQTPGAQNFANHTEYWQTRHSMVVMYVPAGVHTIRPYWRISGALGKTGVIAARCLTAEAYTS